MKKKIVLIMLILCFSGCATQQSLIVTPVRFDKGITDHKILEYSGDLKLMCVKVIYGGTALRYASTTSGRISGILASLLGVSGEGGRGTVGILSLVSGASYESQSIFDAKGKATICAYGLKRIEKAELKYGRELLKTETVSTPNSGEGLPVSSIVRPITTSAGLDLYETILKTKEVMLKMFMGQVPEKGDL